MSTPLSTAFEQTEIIKSNLLSDQIARQTKIWEFTIKPKVKPIEQSQYDQNKLNNTDQLKTDTNSIHSSNVINEINETSNVNDKNIEIANCTKLEANIVKTELVHEAKDLNNIDKKSNKSLDKIKSIEQPTMNSLRCQGELKPNFQIGNQSIPSIDYGESISLEKPLHFILGEISTKHNEDSNLFYSCGSNVSRMNELTKATKQENYINQKENISTDIHTLNSTSPSNKVPVASVLPDFKIGAPASIIIDENQTLRFE